MPGMRSVFALLLPVLLLAAACGRSTPEPPEPAVPVSVRFASPADGDTLDATFTVRMIVEGVDLAPAGTMEAGTGHLHVLIDTAFVDPGVVIPMDEHHRHFGDASTEAQLTLEPGEHTLRLQLADGAHIALEGGEFRHEIRVVVR
jgi:hypothetical protein